jgi:hypothetical protein
MKITKNDYDCLIYCVKITSIYFRPVKIDELNKLSKKLKKLQQTKEVKNEKRTTIARRVK